MFLGWILLERGGVNVYVHAVAGPPCCPLVAVGACVVAAAGGVLMWVDERHRNERLHACRKITDSAWFKAGGGFQIVT